MIELPESRNLAAQLLKTIQGKTIQNVTANHSPHKFAWFRGDPNSYVNQLRGKTITGTGSFGGMVEIYIQDMRLVFTDGTNIRYFESAQKLPDKHQLRIDFHDGSALLCSVQMYGGLWLLSEGETEPYNECARCKVSPYHPLFDLNYFYSLYTEKDADLSAKAFLATHQRIPGLGNGVLQDILFNAEIHPKRKMKTLSHDEFVSLYQSIKSTLQDMDAQGGRNTEKDIFGVCGGYETKLSAKTKENPCPVCGGEIMKEAYLGGAIYYCPDCQPLI